MALLLQLLLPLPLLLLLLLVRLLRGGQPGLAGSYPRAPTLLLQLQVSCCRAALLQPHSHPWGWGEGGGVSRERELGVLSRREGSQLFLS